MEIRFEGVTVRYGDVPAVDELTLTVPPGELLVLVGPSGSGKSTALRVVAGLEPPAAGTVLLDGRDSAGIAPHRRGVAMVFQDYALYPHLTVHGNLAFGLRVRREDNAAARVGVVAEQLGLDDLLDRYPDQLSGGQQQRVALGRAMVRAPAVYLLDEPLSNLDARLRLSAREEIVALQRRLSATMLYVTHDQAEAMSMADRVAVMDGGRLQQVGTPQEVYDTPANVFVAGFLGSPPMNLVGGGGVLGGAPGTTVGVRAEDLHVDGSGPLELTVAVVEHLGSETVLAATAADGSTLHVRVEPRAPYRAGDTLRAAVDELRRHVFGPDGMRL